MLEWSFSRLTSQPENTQQYLDYNWVIDRHDIYHIIPLERSDKKEKEKRKKREVDISYLSYTKVERVYQWWE